MSQTENQTIWNKHTKDDNSPISAKEAVGKLSSLNTENFTREEVRKEHAELSRLALVLSKSAALKTNPEQASEHLKDAIRVLLEHYPASAERSETNKRSNYWEGAVIENQSAQLICLRDMLSLLEFVAKVAPSEEINNLNKQILVLLLTLSKEKPEEIFALISLIEKADYKKSAEAFKVYSEKYCSVENQSLDQIITVSTRFLERTIKENSSKDGTLALENIFKVLVKDKSYLKRIVLDMLKAIFPSLRDKIVDDAAQKIAKESINNGELREQISELLKLSFVGADFSGMKTEKTVKIKK